MGRIISFEEACALPRVWNNIDVANTQLFIEANENNLCKLYWNTSTSPCAICVLIKDLDLDEKTYGFLVYLRKNEIDVYTVEEEDSTFKTTTFVCTTDINISLSELITKAKNEANKCPICRKLVPYNEQSRFSYSGRCCKECLPKMKAKYE